MADNVTVTAGTGTTIAADEVVDSGLGTVKVQYVKLMDGTLNGTAKAVVAAGGLSVINSTGEYETVAASQTAQVIGATGAAGDYISGILVIPASTSPGSVILLDNAISMTVFLGGASSVSNLVPFLIPLGMISVSGAWKITTGIDVSCVVTGNFT